MALVLMVGSLQVATYKSQEASSRLAGNRSLGHTKLFRKTCQFVEYPVTEVAPGIERCHTDYHRVIHPVIPHDQHRIQNAQEILHHDSYHVQYCGGNLCSDHLGILKIGNGKAFH